MAEYIEREAALNAIKDEMDNYQTTFGSYSVTPREFVRRGLNIAYSIIKNQPAADVQEVRYGRNETQLHPADEFICSECGICFREMASYDLEDDVFKEFYFKYCPNCGAKMDEDGEQE